jgi:hypothetical protein
MLAPNTLLYPRPEYPRPDRQRGTEEGRDWLNLNGPWQFRFDPDRQGVDEHWFDTDQTEWREQIIVPFCWESLAAWGDGDSAGNDNYYSTRVFRNPLEVTRENHRSALRYEVGWYRRQITIPKTEDWNGKRVILTIGAADFFTDCWCNGLHLGRHEGGYTPFEFDITDALRDQDKERCGMIVIRVEDPMDNSEQPVGKQWRWYTTTSGIWQTVFVEPRDSTYVHCYKVFPDIHAGIARFLIDCVNAGSDCSVEIEIAPSAAGAQTTNAEVVNGKVDRAIKLSVLRLWDPNLPNLYNVTIRLRRGDRTLDTIHGYFGMRKIDFEFAKDSESPTALRINGVARYLRGALHQSYYPDGVYTATSVETLKNDISFAKKFGFNFLRIHIKIDDPLLLHWADRLGMLLMADFPNFGEGGDTPKGRSRFEQMMREGIERDFNHPSIFAWCLFNETWGFGGQMSWLDTFLAPVPGRNGNGGAAKPDPPPNLPPQQWVQAMWELAKALDPSRLVEDMSVCHWDHLEYYQHCDTDINSWHFYINDYYKAKEHLDKIVAATFLGSSFNYVPGFLHKGQPLINSEYGGVGALDGDRDVSWSFKFLTNELRKHQQIAAYIYTELHDVEWEYNGFLNYDRTPKQFGYDPRIINESNTLPVDSAPIQRCAPGGKVSLRVFSSHYSSKEYGGVSLHWHLGGTDPKGRLHQNLVTGRAPISFPHRRVAEAHTIELNLPSAPMLCTLWLDARTADGVSVAQNFVQYFLSSAYPPDREDADRSLILRGAPANWAAAEWSGGTGEREKERAEDCCYGFGHGFFEWRIPVETADLERSRRIKVLCEASSHRIDSPQTDDDIFPTTLRISVNDVRLHESMLRNHPHDARGSLSYLRGGVGAYGYLVNAVAQGEQLQQVIRNRAEGVLRFRCSVPADALAQGGLTLYGAECGRFPVCPTIILEW